MENAEQQATRLAQDLIAVGDYATRREAAAVFRNLAAATAEPAGYLVEYRGKRVLIEGQQVAANLARMMGGTYKPLAVVAGHC